MTRLSLLFLLCVMPLFLVGTSAFSTLYCPQKQKLVKRFAASNNDNHNDDETTDLFDYFDPLLSPHAYPNGIAPDQKPADMMTTTTTTTTSNDTNTNAAPTFGLNVLGMDKFNSNKEENEETTTTNDDNDDDDEIDLFDYFDPLKSPHEYPNGISPEHNMETKQNSNESSSSSKPFSMNVLGMDQKEEKEEQEEAKPLEVVQEGTSSFSKSNTNQDADEPDLFDYFDPLKSPHEYPNGISPNNNDKTKVNNDDRYNPLALGGTKKQTASSGKVGILLMDHGSRNPASNKRLHHLADLYQMTMEGEYIVVRAAHMEIASPSIPEGLARLLSEGVDEIICHPYFLSPGRHVREDIPEIVDAAIASLKIEIPVITTDPVGSNTQLMLGAIHSSVREKSQIMRQNSKNN